MARVDVRCQVAQIDEVLDTRTLSACLRVANAAGIHAIIVIKDRSAGMTDVVL
jgi:23S rRNA (guanosine2251-2'-O)-methyltransferase